ncbi:MAG: hypothetical protein MJZ01_00080 [Bacteroidales bacterium]|nr:hypothetical protein [Bacteroidales bacterium]
MKESILKIREYWHTAIAGRMSMMGLASPGYYICVFILAMIYIFNHISVESDLRDIAKLTAEIKDLHDESISASSELMNMSKQSEILRRIQAEGLDLKELTEPPRIIEK